MEDTIFSSTVDGQGEKSLTQEKAMKRKKLVEPLLPGPYGRMNAAELDEEVAKFDQEFVGQAQ